MQTHQKHWNGGPFPGVCAALLILSTGPVGCPVVSACFVRIHALTRVHTSACYIRVDPRAVAVERVYVPSQQRETLIGISWACSVWIS
eukprot:366209-Chlamydomonas_euryale.AAC.7